jgi:hypothetical protein
VLFCKFDQPGTAGQIPFPPGGDYFHFGIKSIIAKFEADLIVAFAGCAMGDSVGAGQLGNLDLALGNQRSGDRSAEQIEALVQRVGAHHRKDEIPDEFFAQIVNEDMFRLHAECLSDPARRAEFFTLPQIRGEGHHFTLIFLLQPFQDNTGIKAAGKSENYAFDVFVHHISFGKLERSAYQACFASAINPVWIVAN